MARLASQMRAGFYPTPREVIPLITSFIQPAAHKGSRVLDPCAGEGRFLHDTAVALNLMPFGVERNPDLVAGHRRHILESDYRLPHHHHLLFNHYRYFNLIFNIRVDNTCQ